MPAPQRRRRLRRILLWSTLSGGLVLVSLFAISVWLLRPASLKPRVEAKLSEHLNLDVTIEDLFITVLPRPQVRGTGMTFRIKGRPDLPPFVHVGSFWMDIGLLSVMRKHVDTVHLDDMKIIVPPGKKSEMLGLTDTGGSDPADEEAAPDRDHVIVNHLVSHNTELRFLPGKPGDAPLVFTIHELTVDDVGFSNAMRFHAQLTNPVPRGQVETRGSFGPWRRDDPDELRLEGTYTFTSADLDTIDGIGGRLSSKGSYQGRLTEIHAKGTTETADFSLDLGGKPVPLTTTYEATIDGTNGSTRLDRVDAKLRRTPISAKGMIRNLPGPDGHDINLTYSIRNGRIEDILSLAMDSPAPMMTGNVNINGSLALPPGRRKVRDRLRLAGKFGLDDTRFSDGEVQQKLQELSRRSQGINKDDAGDMDRVASDLHGDFRLASGTLTLADLTFQLPGAAVALAGTYRLEDQAIDMRGTLSMQATVSKAMGGFKSVLLKPFDFIFRKDGSGAVIPIKITGTRDAPKMGVEVGKVFRKGPTSVAPPPGK
jgi:hypothetical protein